MTLEILFLFPRIHNIHLLKYLIKYLLHNEVNALQYMKPLSDLHSDFGMFK